MLDKIYQVEISEQAAKMLVNHADFMSAVSVAAAERLVVLFEETADSLRQMPHRGTWLNSEGVPHYTYRYLLFGKWYLLIYRVIEDTVFVDYVVDGRQEFRWLIH